MQSACASVAVGPLLGCERRAEGAIHERIASLAGRRFGRHSGGRALRLFYPKGCLGNLKPIVAAFRGLAKVDVELIEASLDEISAEMILANQVGRTRRGFDVAIPATFGIPDLVEAGAIAKLGEFAAQHEPKELMKRSIYTLGDYYKGELYGYQTDGDAYLMFYNRRWLEDEALGREYASRYGTELRVPLTWAELDRQMQFFHRPKAGRFGGSLYRNQNYIAWEFWARLHAQGLFPVGDDMRPRFDRPEVAKALAELVAANASLAPDVRENGLFENFRSYAKGDKYANIGWGGTQKTLNGKDSALRGALSFGPVPGGVIGGRARPMPYFNWGWNYVVSSRARDPEAAYLFALFASTPHASTLAVRQPDGYFDPYRKEHYEDAEIQSIYGDGFLAVHRESMASCIPDFYVQGRGRYLGALKRAVYAVSEGQMAPEKALSELASKWERLTDKIGRDSQVAQWKFLKSSYPEELRAALA